MAEMTKDMYGAIGKFGNKTYYQRMGKTIVRTNTTPKNPKTEDQSLQRVLLKAVNNSYSQLKEICNHSFEDYDNAFDCMNKFKRVNLMYLSSAPRVIISTTTVSSTTTSNRTSPTASKRSCRSRMYLAPHCQL